MIRTTLFLTTTPELAGDVLDVYEREQILQYSLDHSDAISAELSVSVEHPGQVMITALWPSAEAYQVWVDDPERARTSSILRELLSGEVGAGGTWDVLTSLSSEEGPLG
jgi:hypothetical protein